MSPELTSEEIVTNLLSSHEILKKSKENFYITSPANLGDYLNNLPKPKETSPEPPEKFDSRYTFIKNGDWKF